MKPGLSSPERIVYRLTCPNCRKVVTESAIASLVGKSKTIGTTPGCRKPIDLQTACHQELVGVLAN